LGDCQKLKSKKKTKPTPTGATAIYVRKDLNMWGALPNATKKKGGASSGIRAKFNGGQNRVTKKKRRRNAETQERPGGQRKRKNE